LSREAEGPLGPYSRVPFCEAKCIDSHFAIDPRRPGADRQDRDRGRALRLTQRGMLLSNEVFRIFV